MDKYLIFPIGAMILIIGSCVYTLIAAELSQASPDNRFEIVGKEYLGKSTFIKSIRDNKLNIVCHFYSSTGPMFCEPGE